MTEELDVMTSESEINNNKVDSGEAGDNEIRKKGQKTSKSKNLFKSKKLSKSKKMVESDFFTPGARLAFTKLRQIFIKVLILHYFDSERHIQFKINLSGYIIGGIFS